MEQNTSTPSSSAARLSGVVSAHPKGFGFATTEAQDEHFIPPQLMRDLLPGDTIEFTLEAGKKPGALQVGSPRVVNRPETVWVGTLRRHRGAWVLEPDEACFATLEVPGLSFAAEGLVVSVRVPACRGPRVPRAVHCRLERILGERTRAGFDVDYAVAKFDFEPHFSEAALREAAALSQPETGAPCPDGRVDLRSLPYVTIDGESTRDFDDAVWAEAVADGWRVGVAIADVSFYVHTGTVLNKEARAKATSVYLPGRTFPMLPEAVSNGVCSLLPDQDRYVVALELDVAADGSIRSSRVSRAVIRSAQRLTYTDVNLWKDGQFEVTPAVGASLTAMWALYEQLATLRRARGQLDFDAPEPKVVDAGGSTSLEWMARTEAHKLVEELMLLANQCVASRLQERAAALFRHQPKPAAEDWQQLAEFAASRGATLPETPSMTALADLRAAIGPADALKADLHTRNSMRPASYETAEPSHFSLGYAAYTHFTSPIRRYADLVVHRLLLESSDYPAQGMAELAAHCSKRSRDARMAERMVWDKIKKRAMFASAAGDQQVPAHVVSQSRNGLRAVADAWQASVFVSAAALQDSGYAWDAASENWTGEQDTLELGSRMSVRLQRIEEEKARTEVHALLVSREPASV